MCYPEILNYMLLHYCIDFIYNLHSILYSTTCCSRQVSLQLTSIILKIILVLLYVMFCTYPVGVYSPDDDLKESKHVGDIMF